MPPTLEAPWNGVAVVGGIPEFGTPGFLDASTRRIQRLRVLLDPRVVMPPPTAPVATTIPVSVYGAPMTATQSKNARIIIQTCQDRPGLTTTQKRRAAVLSLACAAVESTFRNLYNTNVPNSYPAVTELPDEGFGSTATSVGIMQQEVGPNRQYGSDLASVKYVMDPKNSTNLFLDRLLAVANWATGTAGSVIQAAQQSGANQEYTDQVSTAEAILTHTGFPMTTTTETANTIPQGIKDKLLLLAEAAQRAETPISPGANVGIEWCLDAATYPVSATASRRPRVSDLVTFWTAMHTLLGDHPSTWGFALLNNPTFAETAAANADPHASMAAYAGVSWSGGTDPATADHQTACRWLETLTRQVTLALRAAGYDGRVVVPTMYAPAHLHNLAAFHPGGPWINDANVWYETSLFPAGLDGTQVKSPYATYNTWAGSRGYRASWTESAYYDYGAGASIIDPDPLAIPLAEPLPPDPNIEPTVPPTPPVLDRVIESDGRLRLEWTAPTSPGSSALTRYEITVVTPDGVRTVLVAGDLVAATVAELANGVEHTVWLRAFNGTDASLPSNTLTGTPAEGLPPVQDPEPEPEEPEEPEEPVPPPSRVEPAIQAFFVEQPFAPVNWILRSES